MSSRRRSLAAAGAIAVGTLGVPLWMAHAVDAADLFRLPSEHVVTGWSTSILFVGMAIALWLLMRCKLTGKRRAAVMAWICLGAAGAWQLLAVGTGFSLSIPGWDRWEDRMSWVTSVGLLLTSCCVVACIVRPASRHWLSWLASLLLVGATLICLGYWYSLPFLHAGDVRPIGFLASFGIGAVGLSLAAIEGVEHSPLKGFFGDTIKAQLLRLFVPLVIVLVLVSDMVLFAVGPFSGHHPAVRHFLGLLVGVLLTALVVGSVARRLGEALDEARRKKEEAEKNLLTLNAELEERVRERTAALQQTNTELVSAVDYMHKLERDLVEVTGREHERIGRDLHDSIGQLITGIGFLSKALEAQMIASGSPGAAYAAQIRELSVQALKETRDLAKGFFPVEIENHGLGYALLELVQATRRTFGVECSLLEEEGVQQTPKDVAVHLYRITQEAVTNAIRHGKATEIVISMANRAPLGRLAVWNNGLPFQPDQTNPGVGLLSMKQRAAAIGGSVAIQPSEEGVEVLCSFPCAMEEQKN